LSGKPRALLKLLGDHFKALVHHRWIRVQHGIGHVIGGACAPQRNAGRASLGVRPGGSPAGLTMQR
jgi:hypothetical protein